MFVSDPQTMERENSTSSSGIKVQALEKEVKNKTVNYKEKRILVEDKNMHSCYKIKDLFVCDFKRRRIMFVYTAIVHAT